MPSLSLIIIYSVLVTSLQSQSRRGGGRTIVVEGPSGVNGVDDQHGHGVGPKIEEAAGEEEGTLYETSHPDSVEEPGGEEGVETRNEDGGFSGKVAHGDKQRTFLGASGPSIKPDNRY